MLQVCALLLAGLAAAAPPEYSKGVAAFENGRPRLAAKHLRRALKKPLKSRRQAELLLARAELKSGRLSSALKRFQRLITPRSTVSARARWGAAEAAFRLKRMKLARKLYLAAVAHAPGDGDVGLALFRAGEKKRLVLEEPDHRLARKLRARVIRKLTEDERLAYGRQLLRRRRWQEAIGVLDQLGGAKARYWAAMARYRTRKAYGEASEIFLEVYEQLPKKLQANALFHGARALSRADFDDKAIAIYGKVVSRYPKSRWAAEAAFLQGWLEYNRGNLEKALKPLESMIRRFPRTKWTNDARWFHAWTLFLLKRYEPALDGFDELAKRTRGALGRGKALYWKGRSLQELHRSKEAKTILAETANTYPLTWYGMLSRQRAAGPALRAAEAPPVPHSKKAESDPLIATVDELIEVGLYAEATREIRSGQKRFRKRHKKHATAILLDRARKAGSWERLYKLGQSFGSKALWLEPQDSGRTIWEAAYPRAYEDLIEKYAPGARVPANFLLAIMRKESGFNPALVSYADARGLLQMIPPTTERVAKALGIKYDDGDLYEPDTNIRAGAWYIGRLYEKFLEQIPLVAASYNAGPAAAMKWCDARKSLPTDEWVEKIPYHQTRGYAKKVTGNYARYLYLYESAVLKIPEKLDCKYLTDEITY